MTALAVRPDRVPILHDYLAFRRDPVVFWLETGIVFAGHETTAVTLIWQFFLLSQNQDVEEPIRDEMRRTIGDRAVTVEDLASMPLVDQAIQETMRLYPPVYVTGREADRDDSYGEMSYPKGTRFLINIRGLHLDPAVWPDPHRFDPARLDGSHELHRFEYIPFLGGPKKCLGDGFAMTEMRLAVPTILQRVHLSYAGSTPAKEQAGFTMKPAGGMPVQAESAS